MMCRLVPAYYWYEPKAIADPNLVSENYACVAKKETNKLYAGTLTD